MKKITFLFLNLITAVAFAQSYNFTESLEDWSGAGSCELATGLTAMSVNLTEGGSNPSFGITTASINATANKIAAVTVKNNTSSGPTFIRVSYPKSAGGRQYVNLEMTAGDTEFKTYYFDLTNAEWDGIETDVKVHFKATGNSTYAIPAGVSLLIDHIAFMESIPTTERHTFNFNSEDDAESWSAANGSITSITAGKLTFTPTANKFAKLQLDGGLYHVNASTVSVLHITLQNLSTHDDELRVVVGGGGNASIDLSVSDASEKMYVIDLSEVTGWTGDLNSFQLGFRDKDNVEGLGKSSGTGNIVVNSIVFNNTLATENLVKDSPEIQIVPNPVNNEISITAAGKISLIEVYDLAGKNVLVKSDATIVDVSSLSSGVYVAKIYLVEGGVSSKKFVKN